MNQEFVITANSTVDLPREWTKERGITLMPLNYTIDGTTYLDKEGGLASKEFFDLLREGKQAVTSQINPEEARGILEPLLKEGKDVLHLSFTSGLSGTYQSIVLAAEDLMEEYPERKIIVIDSLCACMGEGLLLYYMLKLKEEGKTMEEIEEWVLRHRLEVCHHVTVDDLHHLQRGGRISKTAAVIGTMVQIKPIIHVDQEGKLKVVGKERGRKKALSKIANMAIRQGEGFDNEVVMIAHGDCLEDAEYVKDLVQKSMQPKEVIVNNIGPVIGSHTGPGVVALFSMGKER